MARGAAVHGDDADSDDDDDLYAGMHSGVLLEGFEHLDVDEIMVRWLYALTTSCCFRFTTALGRFHSPRRQRICAGSCLRMHAVGAVRRNVLRHCWTS